MLYENYIYCSSEVKNITDSLEGSAMLWLFLLLWIHLNPLQPNDTSRHGLYCERTMCNLRSHANSLTYLVSFQHKIIGTILRNLIEWKQKVKKSIQLKSCRLRTGVFEVEAQIYSSFMPFNHFALENFVLGLLGKMLCVVKAGPSWWGMRNTSLENLINTSPTCQ